ncbi:MAG: nucleotide exchange factor GrpE [Parcubacteria group bacterium]|jgi:molecular chaperone GrpE
MKDAKKNVQMYFSQRAVLYDPQQKKYLLAKENSYKIEKGAWQFAGGRVDGVEELEVAFAREVKEELGDIAYRVIGPLRGVRVSYKDHVDGVIMTYLAFYDGGEIVLSEEHSEYKWMSADEVLKDKNINQWVKDAIVKAEELGELYEAENRWKRCVADFDNYKKRQIENQKEFIAYAAEGVISDMLPVVDNFHAATDHIPETEKDNPWVTGIMYIQQQMEKVFEEKGVARMTVKIGDEFDPRIMEAVANDKEEELPADAKVIKIAQPGYEIGTKVLRPARVVLGGAKSKE